MNDRPLCPVCGVNRVLQVGRCHGCDVQIRRMEKQPDPAKRLREGVVHLRRLFVAAHGSDRMWRELGPLTGRR